MSGIDTYYTPTPLAEKLVSYVPLRGVRTAVDFCVGDGDLLKAVAKRYQGVDMYGTDISEEAIDKLKGDYPEWRLGMCDFRDDKSVESLEFLHKKTFDLIVLNPPFTCRGSVIEKVELDNQEFRLSTAMMFLVRALKYLSEDGGLYAILPISCVYSDKDKAIWNYLMAHYYACLLEEPHRVQFTTKCSPNIAMVYVGRYPLAVRRVRNKHPFKKLPVTAVVRGCCRMQNPAYSDQPEALPLIHTTNLQNGSLVNLQNVFPELHFTVEGYGVVIPRVCNPSPNKVALLDGQQKYVLSDCVMVLRANCYEDAEQIRSCILANWSDFVKLYKGTGAQYTTVDRLKEAFGKKHER